MPMPGESSGRLHCTKEGTVGKHIFKAWRPDNHNGLGRRIRTRLVGFFSSSCCGAVKHRPALVLSGGSFFIPGQRSASSPPKRERESLGSKRCGNKTTGRNILPCAKNQPIHHPLLLHYITLLEVLSWSRQTYNFFFPKERKKNQTSKPIHFFQVVSPYNSRSKPLNEQRPTIYHHHQHHNERPTTSRRTQQQQQ